MLSSVPPLNSGSPPLTRGKAWDGDYGLRNPRITPAYAGKRVRKTVSADLREDHPRLRGEKDAITLETGAAKGSPPLTRGKDRSCPLQLTCRGITPAYAGKSAFGSGLLSKSEDHPRLRGEKFFPESQKSKTEGSPPLTRGKDPAPHKLKTRMRITPAYAGKSRRWCFRPRYYRDHPRLRGEKLTTAITFVWTQGSPPLTRGKAFNPDFVDSFDGITPAYAGKSPFQQINRAVEEDHPRLRGEKNQIFQMRFALEGSPPLTRGKVGFVAGAFVLDRITPAYAGKSIWFFIWSAFFWDHPRLRGEKEMSETPDWIAVGSPPLTRGKVGHVLVHGRKAGITPAYAGKR